MKSVLISNAAARPAVKASSSRIVLARSSKDNKSVTPSPATTSATADKKKKSKIPGSDLLKGWTSSNKDKSAPSYNNTVLFGQQAPGLAKSIDADTEWRVTQKALVESDLKTYTPKEAADLVKGNKAVIVDVRKELFYSNEHAEPSISLPLFVKEKGGEGDALKKVILGANATKKNENFSEDAKKALGEEKRTIIVVCSVGGSLETEVTKEKSGDTYVDSQRAFGRDSQSLRAAKALMDAGYTNMAHLEGGLAAWKAEGLPVSGLTASKSEEDEWRTTFPSLLGTKQKKEVKAPETEMRETIFRIGKGEKKYAVWPVIYEYLANNLKSISVQEANEKDVVIVDVSNADDFRGKNITGSVNVPFYRNIEDPKQRRLGNARDFFVGRSMFGQPKERNPNFVEDFKSKVDTNKTIVLTCGRGGSLETSATKSTGEKVTVEEFGLESSSLRAAYELMQEGGVKNVLHMEGGVSSWNAAGLPMSGKYTQKVFFENQGGVVVTLLTVWYFVYLLQN